MNNKSNSKTVKDIVKKEILTSITNEGEMKEQALKDYYEQVKVNQTGRMSIYKAIEYTIKGLYKGFEYEDYALENFIKSLDLNNNSKKEYSGNEYFDLYCQLVARESLILWKQNGINIVF